MTLLDLIPVAVVLFAVLAGVLCLMVIAALPVTLLILWLFFPSSSRAAHAALAPSRRLKPRGLSIR